MNTISHLTVLARTSLYGNFLFTRFLSTKRRFRGMDCTCWLSAVKKLTEARASFVLEPIRARTSFVHASLSIS
jgi:hypothetical protein